MASDMDESASNFITTLGTFAVDLTALAAANKLTVAYGRDKEVDDLLHALASPGELYPIVTGGPRGGKTTLVHHAVNRIVRGECPAALRDARVFEVTPSRILSAFGGPRQWSGKIGDFLSQLAASGAILFVRDFHTAFGLGTSDDDSTHDMAYAMGDLLKSTHPRIVFEARARPLDNLFSERAGLKSLFSLLNVGGLDRDAAMPILRRSMEDLEIVHEVSIGAGACEEALELASRFQVNELLPGSALDLLKDVLSTVGPGNNAALTREVVRQRFISRSGLPEFLVTDDAPYDETAARAFLTQRVYGQEPAVEAILRMVALVRARLNNPLRPMGVFLFIGPTGVGKTELVKALAQYLFGGPERIVRFNMADYSEPWSVFLLFGHPNGETEAIRQGQLTSRLAGQPFAVLLLDEFEKANSMVNQRFLQLFDEGILVNGQGEEVNLRNTIIVLTSNLGAELVSPTIGFRVKDPVEEAEHTVMRQSEQYFRPEFINRLDAVCFFKPLARHVIRQIAQREVMDVIGREGIVRHKFRISVDDPVIDLMVERGYDLRYGARYLKRQIERGITYPLARQIARKRLAPGAAVRLMVRNGEIYVGVLEESEPEPAAAEQAAESRATGDLSPKELRAALDACKARIEHMVAQHRVGEMKQRVAAMMDRIGEPEFWQQPQEATAQMEALNALSQRVDQVENLQRLLEQCREAAGRVAPSRGRASANAGALADANRLYHELAREVPLAELVLCLRAPEDQAPAFVTVRHVGDHGSAVSLSSDWVRDLALMYAEWAKHRNFQVMLLNEVTADGCLTEVTLSIAGFGAYALLKGETGSHRLVRGPASTASKRADPRVMVWARVDVLPDLPVPASAARDIKVDARAIREAGVLADRLTRSVTITAAKGGHVMLWRNALALEETEQHAARFLAAQSAQSQSQPAEALPAPQDDVIPIADQVRVYTLYKQQSVRDLRTNHASTQPKKVLAGELDDFLLAYLQMSVA
jgi:ATP-dependent Clp protease ATP-binding subunit ClpC